jgi:hypothetical protein
MKDPTPPPKKFNGSRRTRTSAFGTPGRISHDASPFYGSRLYAGLNGAGEAEVGENPLPGNVTDRLFCKSSVSMEELPNCSIHLMVTSPPYNVILSGPVDDTNTKKFHRNVVQPIVPITKWVGGTFPTIIRI